MKHKTQLKLVDRIKIENCLANKTPISVICKKLGFSKQTIYREIERNGTYRKANETYDVLCAFSNCCPYKESRSTRSKYCSKQCDRYIQKICKKLFRFPFVCNNCERKKTCRLGKRYYYAQTAQELLEKKLHDSRKGIRISQEDFEQINEIISPLIRDNGQSLNHILTSHKEIDASERTLRNWINYGYTDAKNIDLPRKVSFKPKQEYIHRITKPSIILEGRSYRDYRFFIKTNPHLLISQHDSIEGKKSDSKRILTIHFPSLHFQFGILISNPVSSLEVNSKLLELRNKIGLDEWKRIFPILLCDNGLEFNELYNMEDDITTGEHLSHVFYCNPYCSSQKGACEKNHEFVRYIEPKYSSLDHLDQEKVNSIFSHINSVYRSSLKGVRPIDLAEAILGKKFLDTIGIKRIEPDDVNLTQSLTKKTKHKSSFILYLCL